MMPSDLDEFRLRRFAEKLVEHQECELHDSPIDLVDIAPRLEANSKAVWFRAAGPERNEIIGNVMGGRRRLALALDVDESEVGAAARIRSSRQIAPIEISSDDAPVHQKVALAADADLCGLPVHFQHEKDGAPYISAGIDFAIDRHTGWTNVGCRRLMLRGAHTAGVDLNAPSDLRAMYQNAVAKGERLPVAFAVGSHPVDFMASLALTAPTNELAVMGGFRGKPVPVVKCKTIDVWVPADVEYVIEGYLDERGLVEPEGPYGEFLGYYGVIKKNPVYHVTAITSRRDALFQTATISGRTLGRTDTAVLSATRTEAAVWNVLLTSVREPVAVHVTAASGGLYTVRISLRQRMPGEARNAISSVFGSSTDVKHVYVFDDDIDVSSGDETDWAMATRFQADRDLVVANGFRSIPLDPSLNGGRTGAKAGFDCTVPFEQKNSFHFAVPKPPRLDRSRKEPDQATVQSILQRGPATFLDLMAALGTTDGREIVRALEKLETDRQLARLDDGAYSLLS